MLLSQSSLLNTLLILKYSTHTLPDNLIFYQTYNKWSMDSRYSTSSLTFSHNLNVSNKYKIVFCLLDTVNLHLYISDKNWVLINDSQSKIKTPQCLCCGLIFLYILKILIWKPVYSLPYRWKGRSSKVKMAATQMQHPENKDVGGYVPTRPRCPIAAMYNSPGPCYSLPGLVGQPQHDTRSVHRKYPAWAFGIRHGKLKVNDD